MASKDNHQYDYTDAGFNGFFRRSIGSDNAVTLSGLSGGSQSIRFDEQQVSGKMGDSFSAGHIKFDGSNGRIDIDNDQGEVVTRLGNIRVQ